MCACVQFDRRGKLTTGVVVRYDARSARHELEWSQKRGKRTAEGLLVDRQSAWVDFAADVVYREVT